MKKNYEALAQELRELIVNYTEATAVDIVASEDGIEIYPAKTNLAGSFHPTDEVVDFCRVKRLSNYAAVEIVNGKPVVVVSIF